MRNFSFPGRSPVHATTAMAATSQPLATETAIQVLRSGGNAVDAAVAACAVQCVVEPQSTGIAGDCFALIAPGGGAEVIAYNGSGRSPSGASAEAVRAQGLTSIPRSSPHAVTVPGAIEAWARLLKDHGTRSLGELLQPAIRLARDGYPVHARTAWDWSRQAAFLGQDPNAARVFLDGGKAPAAGALHRQPGLAEALMRVAEEGPDGFYRGAVAEDIVGCLQEHGGPHTLDDLAQARGDYVTPISTSYGGCKVVQCPPNGQGFVALEILNIVSQLGLPRDPLSADRFHLQIEAARLAYADRDCWLADPATCDVPVERLLLAGHAKALAAAIDPARARPASAARLPLAGDTVYLTVVDRDRTAVSFINSLFFSFGSGIVTPRFGLVLHNRGCGFVLEEGHPNCLAPCKRPLHTLIPGMVVRDGRTVMPYGVMGGYFQAAGHAHVLVNLLHYGMDIQEAIDCPRAFVSQGGPIEVEEGIPAGVMEELARRGHSVARPDQPHGGGQGIWIDWKTGVLTGGSDPRKDGCALGY